jgi:hypothetical protein
MSKLNSKTLMGSAVVLMVLALLFMATPLLRVSGFSGSGRFNLQGTNQFGPGNGTGGQNFVPGQGDGLQIQGNGVPGQGNSFQGNQTNPNRQFITRGRTLFGFGLLAGVTVKIIYGLALLISLAAAVGMFLTKRWGQVVGIIMAVVYLLLGLLSFLPQLLLGFARGLNPLNLGLTVLHVVLAVAVIVLALIPAKKVIVPPAPVATPPAPSI